ncbi:hypothetical protein Ae707Ps1_6144c [Pseudonocardia sp. Ae707_Ps1]|nr:hypothetical protein Ae707Ps1_6144c [Pseudonocardia sp. Ae707_Ps1]
MSSAAARGADADVRADAHARLVGNMFLHAVRQHHWDDTLPATALVFPDDFPRRAVRTSRALAEQVMAHDRGPPPTFPASPTRPTGWSPRS